MPEGTAASVWASSPPSKDREPTPREPTANNSSHPRGGRGGSNANKRGRGRGKRQPSTTDAPPQPAATTDAPSHQKLIDRISVPSEAPVPTKGDSPDSKSQNSRRGGRGTGRGVSRKRTLPAKVNTATAQKELEKENTKQVGGPEPEQEQEKEQESEQEEEKEEELEQPKDAPHLINDHSDTGGALTPNVNGLADKLKALNPSAPTTPRPFTPSAIDWAGDTEDASLPDLDDWGVTAKSSSPTEDTKPQDKPAPVAEPRLNGRQNKRKDSKAGKSLTVPNRNGNGNASSRPVTPSSTGFASPGLRGKQLPPRASSRASTLNDAPPQITVTAQEKPPSGLGLAFEEPVFASINDPVPKPPSEFHMHIKPVRAPNVHPNGRGARGRGGRPRMSDGNAQPQPGANTGFGMPSSPYMPPSPHLPPSPYLPGAQLPPNGYGYNPGPPQGYPQPNSPHFPNNGPGFGHQYSHSHPQHSPRPPHHHSPRNPHYHANESPRHQRSSSRPKIAGTALNMLSKTLQGSTTPPPKSKTDVSASS